MSKMKHYFLRVFTQNDGLLQCDQYIGEFKSEAEVKWHLMERLSRCKYLPIDRGEYEIEFSGFLSAHTLHRGYFPMQYSSDASTNYYFTGVLFTLEPYNAL